METEQYVNSQNLNLRSV